MRRWTRPSAPTTTAISKLPSFGQGSPAAFAVTSLLIGLSLLTCLTCLTLGRASAQDNEDLKKQASARFSTGVELVGEGNYEAAMVEFRRAYDLVPDWRLLYNMAQVYQLMQDYPAAVEQFERYLSEGGDRVADGRRDTVNAEIAKLRARVCHLDVRVNEAGAEVFVDDRARGTTPLKEALPVSVGRRKISVKKAGFQPIERYVEVGGGEQTKLDFALESVPGASGDTAPVSDAPVATGERKIPWLLWGVTGGLAAGAVVTGVLALSEKSDAEKKAKTPTTKSALDAAKHKALGFGIASDVLTVGAVVTGVFALVRTLKKPSGEAEPRVSADVGINSARLRIRF
jgi:hypothetical protein